MAQLVQDAAQAGGHTAPHCAPVAAVVHADCGVQWTGVAQPGLHTGQAGGPGPQTAGTEESEAATAQGDVTLRHLESHAVAERLDPPGVLVASAGQEGQVLHLLVADAGGEQLPPDGLPELVLREAVGLLPCERSLVDVNYRLSCLLLALNTEIENGHVDKGRIGEIVFYTFIKEFSFLRSGSLRGKDINNI